MHDVLMSFNEAQQFCSNLGGRLLTIKSKEENDYVKEELSYYYEVWLGAMKQKHWPFKKAYRWQDGAHIDYQNWHKEEKEPKIENEAVFINPDGDWLTAKMNDQWWVVCERSFTDLDDETADGSVASNNMNTFTTVKSSSPVKPNLKEIILNGQIKLDKIEPLLEEMNYKIESQAIQILISDERLQRMERIGKEREDLNCHFNGMIEQLIALQQQTIQELEERLTLMEKGIKKPSFNTTLHLPNISASLQAGCPSPVVLRKKRRSGIFLSLLS